VSEFNKRAWQGDERFGVIMESATDYAFVILDPDNIITGWSAGAQRILGWSGEEVLGQSGNLFFTPEDRAKGEVEIEMDAASRQGSAEDERWHLRKDGSRFWGSGVMTRLRDPEHPGFVKIMRDLTERTLAQQNKDHVARLERERLNTQLQSTGAALHRTEEQLRALARSLLTAQEAERRRIARELHDDLAQQTALIQFSVHAVREALPSEFKEARQQMVEVEGYIESLAADIRKVSHRLHPAVLDDLGLDIALASLCESMSKGRPIPIEYTGATVPPLPPDIGAAVYRIAQEALRNTAKHAPEAAVLVELECDETTLTLNVQDSGPGFDLEQYERGSALGMISMEERALSLGGTLLIKSEPGRGTVVTLKLPINDQLSALS
jgi:PAS domain S-box-containing protein